MLPTASPILELPVREEVRLSPASPVVELSVCEEVRVPPSASPVVELALL